MKTLSYIKNVGIIAHVDAGKTTLSERILYYSGFTHKLGSVDDGNTVMDSDTQEEKRGITINSASITTYWKCGETFQINLIDTPGHVDFVAEVERSLRVLDGAIIVFCAKSGVQPQSEAVWRKADKYEVPRIAFVNKLDRDGADFINVIGQMKKQLGASPMILQIPFGEGKDFKGIIDLVSMSLLSWENESGSSYNATPVPATHYEVADRLREQLLEDLAVLDTDAMEEYLSTGMLSTSRIYELIKKATLGGDIVPVLCGAAYKNKGVQPLLDAVCRYLPSPNEVGMINGTDPETGNTVTRLRDPEEPFSAMVFKVISDKYMGKLSMVRVYSGRLTTGEPGHLVNVRTGEKVRINRLLRILSDRYETASEASAGDIFAVAGVKGLCTGDTLCDPCAPIQLMKPTFPEPVIGYAVEAKDQTNSRKLGVALAVMQEEDPTLHVVVDQHTGQTILNGMGELHLEVILEKIRQRFGVIVNRGNPLVAYKEALTRKTVHRYLFKKTEWWKRAVCRH